MSHAGKVGLSKEATQKLFATQRGKRTSRQVNTMSLLTRTQQSVRQQCSIQRFEQAHQVQAVDMIFTKTKNQSSTFVQTRKAETEKREKIV